MIRKTGLELREKFKRIRNLAIVTLVVVTDIVIYAQNKAIILAFVNNAIKSIARNVWSLLLILTL